jgi:hypothetical protein
MKTTQKKGDKLGKVIQKLQKNSGFCCFNPPKKYTHQLRSSSRFWGRNAMIIRNHQTNTRILGQFKILIQLNNRIVARGQQRGNCTQFHGPLLQIHLGMNRH